MKHNARVFANGIEHHWFFEIGNNLTHDFNRLCFEQSQVLWNDGTFSFVFRSSNQRKIRHGNSDLLVELLPSGKAEASVKSVQICKQARRSTDVSPRRS